MPPGVPSPTAFCRGGVVEDRVTIAALCEKAQVAPPRALYDRTTNKDALFLAVYEHGISRIVTDQKAFGAPASCQVLDPGELIERAHPPHRSLPPPRRLPPADRAALRRSP